jgi:hypothetical protein
VVAILIVVLSCDTSWFGVSVLILEATNLNSKGEEKGMYSHNPDKVEWHQLYLMF